MRAKAWQAFIYASAYTCPCNKNMKHKKEQRGLCSPSMLDIFADELIVHTIFLSPLLSVVLSTSDRGGGITQQRPGKSGSGSGLGPSGDQIGHF